MIKIEKGKPLVLPNGSVITNQGDGGSEVMTADEHAEHLATDDALEEMDEKPNIHIHRYERTLADVHADAKEMNIAMIVCAYTMWGLDSYAIGRQLNIREELVEQVKQSDVYSRVYEELFEAARHIDASTVHGFLQGSALKAARTVVKGLKSRSEDVKLSSAKDILDRSGFRPVDRVEHTHRFEDELRIRYVSDNPLPTIDITSER